MTVLIVLLTLTGASWAQICCIPPQWEGGEGTVLAVSNADLAVPAVITGGISVAYDATNKRVAATMTMVTGNFSTSVGVILDFAQGVQYTVSGNNCTRTPLGAFVPNCIPNDAKLVRSSYMGPPTNKMMINTYSFTRGQLEVSATVTDNTCVPVGEVVTGQTGSEYVIQSVGFSGISAGIKNTNVFSPPSSCMNSPLVPVNKNSMESRLLRRYSALFP